MADLDEKLNPLMAGPVTDADRIAAAGGFRVITDAEGEQIAATPEKIAEVASQAVVEKLDDNVLTRFFLLDAYGRTVAQVALMDDLASIAAVETLDMAAQPRFRLLDRDDRIVDEVVLKGEQAILMPHLLRRSSKKLRQIRAGLDVTFRETVFGDSYAQSGYIWGRSYAQMMWDVVPVAGAGFCPADNGDSLDGTINTHAYGTWTGNNDRSVFYPTPDMICRSSTTVGDNIEITATDAAIPSSVRLFFAGTADGVMSWGINGGARTNVNVQGVGQTVIVDIPAPATPDWALNVRVEAGTVRYGGAFVDGDGRGAVISCAGFGGTTSAHWTSIDATEWQDSVAALQPDLVTILLGTNDKLTGGTPAALAANIRELVRRVRAAVPSAYGVPQVDVRVILPPNIAAAPVARGVDYLAALLPAATDDQFALIDMAKIFGPDPDDYSASFSDDTHPEPDDGGLLIADAALKCFGL